MKSGHVGLVKENVSVPLALGLLQLGAKGRLALFISLLWKWNSEQKKNGFLLFHVTLKYVNNKILYASHCTVVSPEEWNLLFCVILRHKCRQKMKTTNPYGNEPATWVISETFFNTFSHLNRSSHVKTISDFILDDDFEDSLYQKVSFGHPYGRKQGRTKEPYDESEREEWKSWLKTQHSENEDHCIWFHHFMAYSWGNNGNSEWLFWGAPKSLQMVTAAIKLKDACSLEGKPWPPKQHIKRQRHYFVNKGLSSQSYGFSCGHIWMWELDYKESWVQKNWCFWTVA